MFVDPSISCCMHNSAIRNVLNISDSMINCSEYSVALTIFSIIHFKDNYIQCVKSR